MFIRTCLHTNRIIMLTETGQIHNRIHEVGVDKPTPAQIPGGITQSPSARPAVAVDASTLPALNWAEAIRRVDGDNELLGEMAGLFLNTYPDQFARIAEAIENSDAGSLEIHAHTLKGTARVFCAEGVIAAAAKLERLAEKQEWAPAVDCLAVLRSELSRMRPALEQKALPRPTT